MLRRLGGVVVIAAACLVMGATAGLGSLTVSGTATLPEGAVLPGSCIGPVGSPMEHPVSPGAGEGEQLWETATYAYPIATVVDCRRPHAGQVVAIDYGAAAPAAGTMPQFDDLDATCQQQVDRGRAGTALQDFRDSGSDWFIAWDPDVQVTGRVVGPSTADRAAGARWSACALVGTDGSGPLGPPGSAWPGVCLSVGDIRRLGATDADGGLPLADPRIRIPCATGHPAQILATAGSFGGTATADVVQHSCERAAVRYVGHADPTDGGRLRIAGLAGSSLTCLAVAAGGALLDGSLLGLGDDHVPWVG